MYTLIQPWLIPLQSRRNMGSMIFLKALLCCPIILVPFLWAISIKISLALIVGLGIPLLIVLMLFWISFINTLHLQLSVTNNHLLPGLRKRLFVAILLGWIIISVIATALYGLACVVLNLEFPALDIKFHRVVLFWLLASFAMAYFVFFIRTIFIPLAIYLFCIFYQKQIMLLISPFLDQSLIQLCIANLIIVASYFFHVTHPNNKQAAVYEKRFTNQFRVARGEQVKYKSSLLFFLESINQILFLFFMQKKVKAKKSVLYFGLGPKIHWSNNVFIFIITITICTVIKLSELMKMISADAVRDLSNIVVLALAWGIPLSIATSTMTSLDFTKKEQRLMYLLPNKNQTKPINQAFFLYIMKNNAISFLIFISLVIAAKLFLYLTNEEWIALIIFCSLPLFPMVLRDYRHTIFNNSKLMYFILIFTLIMILSASAIFFWSLSVWGWNCGLALASIILFIYRWQAMMRAPPAFPADCP